MWEPFSSYCLPPCNLHFSSIVPTNHFLKQFLSVNFLLTILFLRRKLIGRFPKRHLFKSQILVTMGAASISLMKWQTRTVANTYKSGISRVVRV